MNKGIVGVVALAVAGGTLGFAGQARAQAIDDKAWLQVSAYYPKVDSDISVSSITSGTPGSSIDLETDLDMDDRKFLPAFFAGLRIGGNFSIGAEYYSLSRKGENTLARDIVFEDITYPASVQITSKFSSDIYRLTLGYAFVRKENYEIGGAIGLHAADISVSLAGQGRIGNGTVQAQSKGHSFLAPLPTVGLFGTITVAPKLTLGARVDFLSLSIDEYDGRLLNTQVTLAYRIFKNGSLGVLYRYVDYRVDVERNNYTGRFAYNYSGPAIFLEFGF